MAPASSAPPKGREKLPTVARREASETRRRCRLAEIAGDLGEGGRQVLAQHLQGGHQDHGDQGGNQAILDGGGAGFVLAEALNELGQGYSPSKRAFANGPQARLP